MQDNSAGTPAKTAPARLFSRKIGNTVFLVSVAFSEKSAETIEDKILRLAASEPYGREVTGNASDGFYGGSWADVSGEDIPPGFPNPAPPPPPRHEQLKL